MRSAVALGWSSATLGSLLLGLLVACGPAPGADDGGVDGGPAFDANVDGSVDDRPRRLIGWRPATGGSVGLEVVVLDPATGAGVPLRYEPGVAAWRSPVVDASAGALYVIGARDGRDATLLFALGATDAVPTSELALDGPIERAFLAAESRLIGARRVNDRQTDIVEIDLSTGVTRLVAVIDDLGTVSGASLAFDAANDRVYQASGTTLFVLEASAGRLVERFVLIEPVSCLHTTRDGELRALVIDAFDTEYVSIATEDGTITTLARHDAILGCDEASASDRNANLFYVRAAYAREPGTARLLTFDSETGELRSDPVLLEDVTALALLEPAPS